MIFAALYASLGLPWRLPVEKYGACKGIIKVQIIKVVLRKGEQYRYVS